MINTLMVIIPYVLIVVGFYISCYVLYNMVLLSANLLIKNEDIAPSFLEVRFAIVVPAHNEELYLDRLLKSLNKQHYETSLYSVFVIADNCEDQTAALGRQNKAIVMERKDDFLRGKGYAIKYALKNLDLNYYDAVFIVDADSIVDKDLLQQLEAKLRSGKKIIQCYNGVANADESWFTHLLDVSRTIGNEIIYPGKDKLGLSSNLMGNGMCFSTDILKKYGWDAFTVGEDWEYYAKLIVMNESVAFANKARVYHQESISLKQATTQRMRWSSGRFAVIWKYGFGIFINGLMDLNIRKIDASLPLLFPNPSLGINITIIFFLLSILPAIISDNYVYFVWFLSLMFGQLTLFLSGIMYTRHKFKGLLSLFAAPLFLIWKMGIDFLSAVGRGRKEWVRTARKI